MVANHQRAWIVVADREHGRFFSHAYPGAVLEPAADEIVDIQGGDPHSDRPGRAFDSHGAGRHAMEPGTDYKQNHLQEITDRIAAVIHEGFHGQAFDRLVLIAPPKTLGELRESLAASVRERIVAELPTHLSQVDLRELAERLTALETLGVVRDRPAS